MDSLETVAEQQPSNVGRRIRELDEELQDRQIKLKTREANHRITDLRQGMYGLINNHQYKYHPCAYEFMKNAAEDMMSITRFDSHTVGKKLALRLKMLSDKSPKQARYVADNLYNLLSEASNSDLAAEIMSKVFIRSKTAP